MISDQLLRLERKELEKVMGYKFGRMAQFMKECGLKIKHKVMEGSSYHAMIFTRGNGSRIKLMV